MPLSPQIQCIMGLHHDLPVYKLCYELFLEIFHLTKNFTKDYKYTVGENLKKETIELLTLIFRANSSNDKKIVLQNARERIEIIRLFIWLMKDLQQISLKHFVHVNQKEEDVSKQLTGWQKSQKQMFSAMEVLCRTLARCVR